MSVLPQLRNKERTKLPMKNLATILISFLISLTVFSQTVNDKLKISHLTGDFYVYTTYNSYKGSLVSANAMYLVTSNGVVMFDTSWDTTQFQPLLDSISIKHKQKVVLCLATHSHEDRTGGLEFLKKKGVRTFTSKITDEQCKVNHYPRAEFTFVKDTVFTVGNTSFQTFYGGPGHTIDNIVIWFPETKILYGGCLIKSSEATDLGYVGEADLKKWPATIQKIQKKFGQPQFIIPGHQDWTSRKALDHTLELLNENEKQN